MVGKYYTSGYHIGGNQRCSFSKDNSDRLSRLKQHCSRYSKAAGEYEHLTLKNVHDTITSLVKQREHNLAEKRIWSPYIDNIELLYEHRNEILAHKEWAMATIPLKVYMVCQPICIGTMLRLWANENEWLTYQCECGHKAFIYSFAGSPLSGTTSISYKCIHCHKTAMPKLEVSLAVRILLPLRNKNYSRRQKRRSNYVDRTFRQYKNN